MTSHSLCLKFKRSEMEGKMDNWKNRSDGMICKTCIFFVVKKSRDGKEFFGRCRKYAPTIKGFTPVFNTDWCGDHRLDENKIELS